MIPAYLGEDLGETLVDDRLVELVPIELQALDELLHRAFGLEGQ
jgi:hypothetical protein